MARRSGTRRLAVWSNGERMGVWEAGDASSSFTYDTAWLRNPHATPLSLSMPLAPDAHYRGALVDAWFSNLLPDNRDILQRLQARFKATSDRAVDLLAAVGRDCVGSVQLLGEEETPADVKGIDAEPLSEADIESMLDGIAVIGASAHMDDFRLSLAGAQEKTALLWHNGQWHKPRGATPTTHILKLPLGQSRAGIDLSTSVDNEWICAQLLKAFGLPVANCEIAHFGRHRVLVVERFDRRLSADKNWWLRLPQEDFCQATGTAPALKYEADGGPGIQPIMNILRGAQDAQTDRVNFLKTQILFWLLAAVDGHAKNFSLHLLPRGNYQLTPAYDVMSAWPMLGDAPGKISAQKIKMAMALSGKNSHYHHHEIQLRHFVETFRRAGLQEEVVTEAYQAILDGADEAAQQVAIEAERTGVERGVRELIDQGLKRMCSSR